MTFGSLWLQLLPRLLCCCWTAFAVSGPLMATLFLQVKGLAQSIHFDFRSRRFFFSLNCAISEAAIQVTNRGHLLQGFGEFGTGLAC